MNTYTLSIIYHHYTSSDDVLRQLYPRLTAPQQADLEKLKSFNGQLSYASSRALLNAALAEHLGTDCESIQIEKNAKGKPGIRIPENSRCQFNLSHTHGLSVVAVTDDLSVGIDAESLQRKNRHLAIAKSYFENDEYEALKNIAHSETQSEYFYRLWTLKEAYLKATGGGIADSLSSISAEFNNHQVNTIKVNKPGIYRQMTFSQLTLAEHYMCAIAALSEIPVKVTLSLYAYDPVTHTFTEEPLPATAEPIQVDLQ